MSDVRNFVPTKIGEMTHVGIGVAQGAHPTLGKNAIYVVVLLART